LNNSRRYVNQFVFCFFLLICGFAVNASAQVNNYYVSPSGSDSTGSGSAGSPWATPSKAIAAASMGATGTVIHVAAGTYSTITGCPNDSQTNVCVNRSGSSSAARLIVRCDAGVSSAYTAQGQCKIRGGDAGFFVASGNYVDIVGFDIGNTAGMMTGVKVLDDGAAVSKIGNSVHVIGNYIHDLGSANGGCPSSGGILFAQNHGSGTTDDWAIGNIVARYGQDPSGSCNLAHGIYANTGHVLIQNNIIVQVPTYGITYYSSACFGVVSNNVVINAKGGMVIGTDGIGSACPNQGSNTINNNYFGNISTKSAIVFSAGAPQCTASMPNFFGRNMSDGSAANGDFSSGASSCDVISPASMTHVAGADFFVNYKTDGSGDYHLKAGNPAIGAGTTTCSTGSGAISPCVRTTDFEGVAMNPLPVGAYALGGAATVPTAPANLTATVQ